MKKILEKNLNSIEPMVSNVAHQPEIGGCRRTADRLRV